MIHITLSQEQLERILESLRKTRASRLDSYLINYLENIQKTTNSGYVQLDWDEIPF